MKGLLAYGRELETEHTLNGMLGEPWVGLSTQQKADKILCERGVNPTDATYDELLNALAKVWPS